MTDYRAIALAARAGVEALLVRPASHEPMAGADASECVTKALAARAEVEALLAA
jgi:hypothetical protein